MKQVLIFIAHVLLVEALCYLLPVMIGFVECDWSFFYESANHRGIFCVSIVWAPMLYFSKIYKALFES